MRKDSEFGLSPCYGKILHKSITSARKHEVCKSMINLSMYSNFKDINYVYIPLFCICNMKKKRMYLALANHFNYHHHHVPCQFAWLIMHILY